MTTMSKWVLAGVLALATVPLMAADDTPAAPDRAPDRTSVERAKQEDASFRELLAGTVSVFLEGNTTTPFLTDATFSRRVRIADKEFMLFAGKDGEQVMIRTQTIVAVRIKPAK